MNLCQVAYLCNGSMMQIYHFVCNYKHKLQTLFVFKHYLTIRVVHTLLYIAMDLKDFVSETLKEIIAGVKEAQEYAKEHGAIINPTKFGIVAPKAIMNKDNDEVTSIQRIDFSLSLQQSYAADGKVSIGVLDIGKIEGKYENIKENRVNFSVLITLPCGDTH